MDKKNKNKELKKEIKEALTANEKENKNIIEAIEVFKDIYDDSKLKNYAIIYNLIENTKYNIERLKFSKETTIEEDSEALKLTQIKLKKTRKKC